MPVNVKDYLNSMKSVGQTRSSAQSTSNGLDVKTQALISNLIEAISFAKSIDFRQKTLNKEVASGGFTGKEILDQLKAQEKLVDQLIQGQKLTELQTKELTSVINKFYEVAGSNEINYKKFAAQLERFALKGNLPNAVQTRLVNDSRDAHIIGKEQKDSAGLVLPILKRIRNLLEDGAEHTKQFGKKLFVTLDSFREGFLSAFESLADKVSSGGFLDDVINGIKMVGMAWMLFQGQFKEGVFKFGQLFKQVKNVQSAFKAFAKAGELGKYVKGPVKAIKDLVSGAKMIGKTLGRLPKMLGKFGLGKGLGAAAKGIGKGIAKGLGKGVLKKIPGIGTLLSIWMGVERWQQGDKLGAFIEFGSGIAAAFPGIGTAISIGLDLINLERDTGALSKSALKASEKISPLQENLLMSIPGVGPIFGLMKAIGMFKSGDKKNGMVMIGKSLASIVPGGAFLADLVINMMGLNKDVKPEPQNSNGSSGKFKWFWQKDKNQNGSGDTSYGPQLGAGDSGGSSTFADNLANAAIRRGGGRTSSTGVCALAVGDAFSSVVGEKEASKFRGNAWTWINSLSTKGSKWFKKAGIAGSDKELRSIPKGSIAVWNKQPLHPYGHIEIADGRGNLISDFKRPANLGLYRRNPAGIKPVIFTPKDVKMPKLSGAMSNPAGAEETSSAGDTSTAEAEQPQTFEDVLAAFNAFNEDIVKDVPQTATASASTSSVSAPSIESITAGTPAATTAASTATTATKLSKPATNTVAPAPQVAQTNVDSMSQSTMDTEIRDTDLALLNSILFQ